MKDLYLKIITLTLVAPFFGACFAFAESTTTPAVKEKEVTQVEISFPIQKDDFLLFYGITKNEESNLKIEELRADFISKFKDLKKEYKDAFDAIVKDSELSPIVSLEPAPETKATKDVKKEVAKSTKTQVVATPAAKKYILNEKSQNEENMIPASVNIINDKSAIHIENSSWFQKVKSWFNW
ncbi:MAG: hypothetical protein RI945_135 [Candidatus Parcubacteria bacterium]